VDGNLARLLERGGGRAAGGEGGLICKRDGDSWKGKNGL